jgi:RimJ/RimL family protein N-acetyltransferase
MPKMTDPSDLSDYRPCQMPGREDLVGSGVRLEPLSVTRHGEALWSSLGANERLWTYMPYGPFADRRAFDAWQTGREGLEDPRHMSILVGDVALGTLAFMAIRPDMGVAEIGHVVLSEPLSRTAAATAAFALALGHLFALGYRRVEWKCDSRNQASRRAALRLGFRFEGIFRQHMIVKGQNRDTAWFSLIDREWPAMARAFERWLDPENFDADGRQRSRLAELSTDAQ